MRDWPEVVIEEETREAAITQIKQHLTTYLSQPPEIIQIELEPVVTADIPGYSLPGCGLTIRRGTTL